MPTLLEEVLQYDATTKSVAKVFHNAKGFLFLGRGPMFPVALEGALKLKEISYIHAEGYAGGEMKHGPIALIADRLPVVALAPRDGSYERMLRHVEEVLAREGQVIARVHAGGRTLAAEVPPRNAAPARG